MAPRACRSKNLCSDAATDCSEHTSGWAENSRTRWTAAQRDASRHIRGMSRQQELFGVSVHRQQRADHETLVKRL